VKTRRATWSGFALICGIALLPGLFAATSRADDQPAAAAQAEPSPADSPTKPDPTGAGYTGADISGKMTRADGKVTPDTVTRDVHQVKIGLNLVWALVAGFLVMFMQTGFAMLETGLCRAKNAAHTMAMNFGIYAIGLIGYWAVGFALQMGGYGAIGFFDGPAELDKLYSFELFGKSYEVLGHKGFFLSGDANDASVLTMFLFMMVFMDTAATIPTGAMAERWKFSAFCAYGFVMSMLIYPVYACWTWGGGWLADLGLNHGLGNGHVDFAGSSVVHMTGGVAALAGIIVLGPRIGKFNKDGSPNAIPGHNIPMAVVGTLILAFGWFGFNAGSPLAGTDFRMAGVAVNTMLASGAGCLVSLLYMWAVYGKPDPTMGCNGLLAGLVAITAPCAFVNPLGAVTIGAIAGVLVIWGVLFVERVLKLDDPVGAVAVHGVNGAFGCLAIGLFATGEYGKGWNGVADAAPIGILYDLAKGLPQLEAQAIGVLTNVVWVFSSALLTFWVIEKTIGNRTTARAEIEGLDIHEMGVSGYVNEDSIAVQTAGHEHLNTFGPGVPKGARNGKAGASKVPTGVR
jgi:Amt family ammonium transporter